MNAPQENLAQSLHRILPKVEGVGSVQAEEAKAIHLYAVPANHRIQEVDLERLLPGPRRARFTANFDDAPSFLSYVNRHKTEATMVWCHFSPSEGRLSFRAVFDEHLPGAPAWREHVARFEPATSKQWATWVLSNGVQKGQFDFALFLETNEQDITSGADGKYPSSLQMLQMATNFEANAEKSVKSMVRLQSGGVELNYVDKDDAQTVSKMTVFEKFCIGIPVFWQRQQGSEPVAAYAIEARLRYRRDGAGVKFWYDLVRPDVAHERASADTINAIKAGLDGLGVPMVFGSE